MTKPLIIASSFTLAMGIAAVADTKLASPTSGATGADLIEWDSGVPVGTAPHS